MSFGFSVGDFIAGAVLITEIVEALQGSAIFEYHELELELHGLKRALHEIEHLSSPPGHEAAVNGIKAAALMCQYPLEEFKKTLAKYHSLGVTTDSEQNAKFARVKSWGRKAQWSVSMEKEVQKLRAYIAAHVGSLNMRLATLGLSTIAVATADSSTRSQEQGELTQESLSQITSLSNTVSTRILPQIQGLVDLVTKIWATNLRIIEYFTKLEQGQLSIDVKHTWFQEPHRFEDALGRVIPVPAEYGWTKLHAIVHDQFKSGPGHTKVFAGEYELFLANNKSQLITEESFCLLKPGSALAMALIIGRYHAIPWDLCPKPGCGSTSPRKTASGGFTCEKCETWFGKAQTAIPQPFRSLSASGDIYTEDTDPNHRNRALQLKTLRIMQAMRQDRMWFKNVVFYAVYFAEMADVIWDYEDARKKPKELQFDDGPESVLEYMQDPTSSRSMSAHEGDSKAWDTLRSIISTVLAIDIQADETQSLLSLGLDSLSAMQIRARIRQELGIPVSLQTVVRSTVQGLRGYVERAMVELKDMRSRKNYIPFHLFSGFYPPPLPHHP